MPRYLSYKRNAEDYFNKSEIERWITVNGAKVAILKGQSEKEAVESFIKGKTNKVLSKREERPTPIGEATENVVAQVKNNMETREDYKRQKAIPAALRDFNKRAGRPVHISNAVNEVMRIIKKHYRKDKKDD